jgi:hypothetical protein
MSSSCVVWQYSSGDSPGTAKLSSRTCWSPPKKDKPSDATRVLRSNVTRLVENFILKEFSLAINERFWHTIEELYRFGDKLVT